MNTWDKIDHNGTNAQLVSKDKIKRINVIVWGVFFNFLVMINDHDPSLIWSLSY